MFDLKQLRERAGLTQTQVAQRLNTSQVQISRYESAPDNVPIGMIQVYLAALGLDLATEVTRAASQRTDFSFQIHQPYQRIASSLAPLIDYLESLTHTHSLPEAIWSQPAELAAALRKLSRKPRLLITGSFDAGKSHLANYLLGKYCLPANYQPETRVPIYIRHLDDRPSFMPEDVWVMGEGFEPGRWNDREHVEKHKKIGGNYFTLNDWASHSGRNDGSPVSAALVFVDAPILEGCELIDVPGNLHDQDDQKMASSVLSEADVIVYASPAKGFLNGHDLVQLSSICQGLRVSSTRIADISLADRLVVVATHADPSVSDKSLAEIMQKGEERLAKELASTDSSDELTGLYSFWEETPERNQALQGWLQQLLAETLPGGAESMSSALIDTYQRELEHRCEARVATLRCFQVPENRQSMLRLENRPQGVSRQRILDQIASLRDEAPTRVAELFRDQLDPRKIDQAIKANYSDRTQAHQYAAASITNQLQAKVNEQIQRQMTELLPEIRLYINDSSRPIPQIIETEYRDTEQTELNMRGMLLGGTAGLAGIGPFAAWASQLGPWGGYLVVAESAVALGLGKSGASALVSVVTAIGGPAVLAAATVVTGAVLGASILGRNWRMQLAERIIRSVKESRLQDRMVGASHDYWTRTYEAFEQNSQWLEAESQWYVDELQSIISSSEPDRAVEYLVGETERFRLKALALP